MNEMEKGNDPIMEEAELQIYKQQMLDYQLKRDAEKSGDVGEPIQYEQAFPHFYQPSPREYLHNFLISAKSAGCNVDCYIEDEIKRMLDELSR